MGVGDIEALDAEVAARELLWRRYARANLIGFTQYTNRIYQVGEHHKLIASKLEAVARGGIDRLMIFMPPRHGKSELASRRFPAWYLGRYPDHQVIAASYNSELATDFGRQVRNIVNSREYRALFDVSLAQDSQAADRWNTDAGGAYVAAGIGTAVTGRGAHVLLIDDPFKDREEADSELRRQRVWDWYTSTAYTRLMPGGSIVLIQTRWHEDDLAGRLLAAQERGGDQWQVLELPALSETGVALWPEWYPTPALERIKGAIGPRDWSALYQQRPQPDEGTYFKREWFRWYDERPKHLRIYGSSDYAVTEGSGDATEHGIFGVDPDDNLFVLDWWSGQTASDVWIEEQLDLSARFKPLLWFGESGVIKRAIEPFLIRRMRERRVYQALEWLPSIVHKEPRARGFQARASMGKVYLPNNEIGRQLLDQLLRFPTAARDDKVDTCSLIGRGLDQIASAQRPQERKRDDGPKPFTIRWLEHEYKPVKSIYRGG